MSLTGALFASRSGLTAAAARSETAAANIANASTPGYVKRGTVLVTRNLGGGALVEVSGIRRDVDASLQRLHRQEVSRMGTAGAAAGALQTYALTLGQPGGAGTLSSRMTALQSAFDALAGDPGSGAGQRAALEAVEDLAGGLNALSGVLAQTRADLTAEVAAEVTDLNRALGEIAGLNQRLSKMGGDGAQRAAIEDEIDKRLDALAPKLQLSVARGPDGQVTLRTAGGATLLTGNRAETVVFDRATGSLAAGEADITPGRAGARGFSEGELAGKLKVLTEELPRLNRQIDEMARGLIEGFAGVEGSGAPGLFTDAQGGYDPATLDGLAGRIAVNDAVRPEAGGALWRIRDGMGATEEGPPGDATRIGAYLGVLEGEFSFSEEAGLGTSTSFAEAAAGIMADAQVTRGRALDRVESLTTTALAFEEARSGVEGVNVDDELQQLIAIEQAYAANSRTLSVVAEMLDRLLEAV